MSDQPRTYLVRWTQGRSRPDVFAMRHHHEPRRWHFQRGVCVMGQSLSDALFEATGMINRLTEGLVYERKVT